MDPDPDLGGPKTCVSCAKVCKRINQAPASNVTCKSSSNYKKEEQAKINEWLTKDEKEVCSHRSV
jgi:hypothetical protein